MSGGAGAVAGGLFTGRRRKEKGEGRAGYLGRILTNALLAGGMTGGAHYLGAKGLENTVGNLADSSKSISGGKGDEGPMVTAVKNLAFSPLIAGAAGATALGATHGNSLIGAGNTASPGRRLTTLLGPDADADWMHNATPKQVSDRLATLPAASLDEAERLRRAAGVPSARVTPSNIGGLLQRLGISPDKASTIQGAVSNVGRRGLKTFGQSVPRVAGRGALALTAASLPALIGAMVTNKTE